MSRAYVCKIQYTVHFRVEVDHATPKYGNILITYIYHLPSPFAFQDPTNLLIQWERRGMSMNPFQQLPNLPINRDEPPLALQPFVWCGHLLVVQLLHNSL